MYIEISIDQVPGKTKVESTDAGILLSTPSQTIKIAWAELFRVISSSDVKEELLFAELNPKMSTPW